MVQQKLTADIQKSFLLISEKNSCRDPRSINPTKLVRRIHNLWINGMSYQFNWQSPYLSDPSNVAHQLSTFPNFPVEILCSWGSKREGNNRVPPKKSRDTTFGVKPTNQQDPWPWNSRPKKNVCPPQLRLSPELGGEKKTMASGVLFINPYLEDGLPVDVSS